MKASKILRVLAVLVIISIAFSAVIVYLTSNHELHLANITSNMPYRKEWEISPLTNKENKKLTAVLSQPFFYLSEGGQSYVFSSVDQHYVLKLFKFKRFRPSFLVSLLPNIPPFQSYRNKHIAKREHKLILAFNSHKLAYDLHRHASGLIFVQLNGSHFPQMVTLIDKAGSERRVNLEAASYIVQEKGEILSSFLSHLLDQGDVKTATIYINQLFDLYVSEYAKGIYDMDHGVMHNIGYIENRLFHLDVGKLVADERTKDPEFYQKDLIKVALKVRTWLRRHYPQYYDEISDDIEAKLSHIFGKKFEFSLAFSPN